MEDPNFIFISLCPSGYRDNHYILFARSSVISPLLHFGHLLLYQKQLKNQRDIKYEVLEFTVSKFTLKLLENFQMSIFVGNSIYLFIDLKNIIVIKYKDVSRKISSPCLV